MSLSSDERETSRVIGIHDGARGLGYGEGMADVIGAMAELMRRRRIAGVSDASYSAAIDDVLQLVQALMAMKRKKI